MKQVTTWGEIWKVETLLLTEAAAGPLPPERIGLCAFFFHYTKRESYDAFAYLFRPEENTPTSWFWFDTIEERLTALALMRAMVDTGDFYYEPPRANAD